MDSHSRYGRGFSGGSSGGGNNSGNNQYRRYSRSRSRSRERNREQAASRRRNTRSRSREHYRKTGSADKDLYRDLINDDYGEERGGNNYNSNYNNSRNNNYHNRRDENYDGERDRNRERDRERDRDRDRERDRDRDRERDRDQRWKNYDREPRDRNSDYERSMERSRDNQQHNGNGSSGAPSVGNRDRQDKRYQSEEDSYDSDISDDSQFRRSHVSSEALNQIIIFGLKKHITEADIMGALIQVNMEPSSIRLIRKRPTGASRGFAFVEFNTVEEAKRWMDITQGTLKLGDQRVSLQYSHKRITDWHCVKCGVYNFKRRFSCFTCMASRAESESIYSGGGEGIDEVSPILTKKIMLRNLDALTNEESVLTALQKVVPKLAKTIQQVIVSRDTLTQTSRGFCYLIFETLVDSMELHNALTALNPPLRIDDRDVCISYCMDLELRAAQPPRDSQAGAMAGLQNVPMAGGSSAMDAAGSYTLDDVPRLAEYSASLYAKTPAEHAHYVQYYTDYYIAEIKKGGQLPTLEERQVTEANSGAAVALSAIQRKQKKMNNIETTATAAATAAAHAAAAVKATFAAQSVIAPRGNDGKTYPTPDVSRYQYDETSGYYYDPSTGLYYDAHSQYYYNNETGAYLYWDQRRSTYILATPASTQAALQETLAQDTATDKDDEAKKDKGKDSNNKPDKVKVAKKIVKDMEKWAKQLNQKKDYTVVATPQPILPGRGDLGEGASTSRAATGAYADVGFSILEKKERAKLSDYVTSPAAAAPMNKLVNIYGGGSDSEEDNSGAGTQSVAGSGAAPAISSGAGGPVSEMDYVDFQKLTCLLCKRAFQSHDILQKHLKMSNLHKENLAKLNVGNAATASAEEAANAELSYRDRAKERRLKYGEGDPPPPNRSRERFEHEIKNLQTRQKERAPAPPLPISSNNVGNRLLQKMGWSEGQGLGRKNQGRTQIIEAEARSSNVGLGNKAGTLAPGDDYKTYIKKMMKSRYENA